ncbi:GTP-binding protein Rheb isoform 3-T3 [Sylvia borin]
MPPSKSRKIAILGYRSVGKSSLTIQFVEGQFVDSYDPTIENTFTKLITVNGQEYHLQLVDTAGQDEYSIFPQTYSIDINGYILVYSVTSIKRIPIMLVGNKKDLHMERVISYEEGKALAESWNAAFLESSAKENQTAVDVFKRIILEAEKIDGAASQGKSSCSVIEGVRSLEPMDCLTYCSGSCLRVIPNVFCYWNSRLAKQLCFALCPVMGRRDKCQLYLEGKPWVSVRTCSVFFLCNR